MPWPAELAKSFSKDATAAQLRCPSTGSTSDHKMALRRVHSNPAVWNADIKVGFIECDSTPMIGSGISRIGGGVGVGANEKGIGVGVSVIARVEVILIVDNVAVRVKFDRVGVMLGVPLVAVGPAWVVARVVGTPG